MVQAKLDIGKGVSPTSGIKKIPYKEEVEDSVNGQSQNNPLITDTGSVLYEKAFFKAQFRAVFLHIAQLRPRKAKWRRAGTTII